jgi:hypothetical protein
MSEPGSDSNGAAGAEHHLVLLESSLDIGGEKSIAVGAKLLRVLRRMILTMVR